MSSLVNSLDNGLDQSAIIPNENIEIQKSEKSLPND